MPLHVGLHPAGDVSKNIEYCKNYLIVPAMVCIIGLTVTFWVAVVSQGISKPNAENFPHPDFLPPPDIRQLRRRIA